ncbi:MAG TPA: hypothetical protein VHD57_00780 [Vicinamibacterales bacterium]|nr:hypothetical protein [Vicinamibacterales bacterium]
MSIVNNKQVPRVRPSAHLRSSGVSRATDGGRRGDDVRFEVPPDARISAVNIQRARA